VKSADSPEITESGSHLEITSILDFELLVVRSRSVFQSGSGTEVALGGSVRNFPEPIQVE
jgi:hypothetical protein